MSEKQAKREAEKRMNACLQHLGFDFTVTWTPDPTKKARANIDLQKRIIHIYDNSEQEAWISCLHECLELRLRPLLSLYRGMINTLIDFLEKEAYTRKEKFLESLPKILSQFEDAKMESDI